MNVKLATFYYFSCTYRTSSEMQCLESAAKILVKWSKVKWKVKWRVAKYGDPYSEFVLCI